MAAYGSDAALKPLQNAMKMAKTAIQMDAENKHRVILCLVSLLSESLFKSHQKWSITLCQQACYLLSTSQVLPTATISPPNKTLHVHNSSRSLFLNRIVIQWLQLFTCISVIIVYSWCSSIQHMFFPPPPQEAYCEYLRSINYISHALLDDAVTDGTICVYVLNPVTQYRKRLYPHYIV